MAISDIVKIAEKIAISDQRRTYVGHELGSGSGLLPLHPGGVIFDAGSGMIPGN